MFLAFKVLISFLGATAVNANLAEPAGAHLQNEGPSTGQTKTCLLATMLVTV